MGNVGKARFKEMCRNMEKRIAKARITTRIRKMRFLRDIKLHIKVLTFAVIILYCIVLSGCSGNYRIGDTSKVYCQAVDAIDPVEMSKVLKNETTVEH